MKKEEKFNVIEFINIVRSCIDLEKIQEGGVRQTSKMTLDQHAELYPGLYEWEDCEEGA